MGIFDFLKGGVGKMGQQLITEVSGHAHAEWEGRRIVKRASAEAEAEKVRLLGAIERQELLELAEQRHAARLVSREENLLRIVHKAALLIGDGSPPVEESEEPPPGSRVNPDWTARFIAASEDVGDEQMQELWAQLLAGEYAKPGSYSVRTIETVRVLSREEADLFAKFVAFQWRSPRSFGFVIYTPNVDQILQEAHVHSFTRDQLASMGLMQPNAGSGFNFSAADLIAIEAPSGNAHVVRLGSASDDGISAMRAGIELWSFTGVGAQLSRLCTRAADGSDYEQLVIEALRTAGYEAY